jgi:hypothetical protein
MIALDIETSGLALEPWRIREGKASIDLIGVGDSKEVSFQTLNNLTLPKTICCWNAVFDVAFLYAAGYDVKQHQWIDARLLTKWIENGQEELGYTLSEAAQRWLTDWEYIELFTRLKAAPEDNERYWKARCKLDVIATSLLADKMLSKLTLDLKRAALIEAGNIVPNAIAWVEGLPTNPDYYELPIPELSREMAEIECRLGVSNAPADDTEACYGGRGWLPSKILRSPQQLGVLLYEKWNLPLKDFTEKGAPATNKAALTYLSDDDDKPLEILAWREKNTLLTKFCQSPEKARKYLDSSTLHPAPRIFGTYTGRYTYSSKLGKGSSEVPVAMALHQIPRGPRVRRMVEARDGECLVEFDASNQEIRLIAEIGNIETMLDVFRENKKFHAITAAAIGSMDYDEFMTRYKAKAPEIVDGDGLYACGKFVGLSNNYRIGVRKSRVQARIQYGIQKDIGTIELWQQVYHNTHPGLKQYWDWAIRQARNTGYAETLAGRRYYLTKWTGDDRWSTESSAINFPIQGSGGDMKNLAITTLDRKYPEARFAFDLHDGIFYWLKLGKDTKQLIRDMNHTLDHLNYEGAWGWKPRIEMPWEAKMGLNWGEMESVR